MATSRQGNPYVRLSVAVDQRGKTEATWYTLVITGRKAENAEALLNVFRKGRLVHARGEPDDRVYQKADGTWAVSRTIVVDELPLLLDAKPKD